MQASRPNRTQRGSVGPASVSASATHHRIRGPTLFGALALDLASREARHAGARQARTATANSVGITPERTTGSRGLVPDACCREAQQQAKLGAQTLTIEQHQLQELIALRTECRANSMHRSFGETQRAGRSGIIQGACYCALKVPRNLLKLLI